MLAYEDGSVSNEGNKLLEEVLTTLQGHVILSFWNSINNLTRMMVKSARTKKFDDEIDLIFKNRGLDSLGYI